LVHRLPLFEMKENGGKRGCEKMKMLRKEEDRRWRSSVGKKDARR
jgi:hypothetical protein